MRLPFIAELLTRFPFYDLEMKCLNAVEDFIKIYTRLNQQLSYI